MLEIERRVETVEADAGDQDGGDRDQRHGLTAGA